MKDNDYWKDDALAACAAFVVSLALFVGAVSFFYLIGWLK